MNVIKENIINAKGKIDYTFTNDFVFRAILQRNKNVLTSLICSLLHLPTDEVDVTITNPIELGNAFSDKDFILDIRVEMNDGRFPQTPEFYATYQLMNIKTHQLYSSKFSIHVVDLSRIDLAT